MTDLFSQPGTKRYQFFLDHIAESPLVWSLSDDGGIAVSETSDGTSCFSVWPSDYYAQQCAIEDWANYRPEPIPTDSFVNEWLTDLANAGLMISVFPAPGGESVEMPAEALREEIMKHQNASE